ncbi:MAG: hypothetical protein EB127_31775, partial [Alphaproteobacteria bacterium]|nr:hypothetical protein [Alphaproteobacteria bacterium]
TCIRYIKSAASQYDSRGLIFEIWNSTGTKVSSVTLTQNTPIEDCDLRIDPTATMYMNPSRKGVCGYMGRYVNLSKPAGQNFTLSQIAVVSLNGVNVALNKTASFVTDGNYRSRPSSLCPSANNLTVDLGTEMEVVAVHLYGTSDATPNLKEVTVNLKTEDNQLAYFDSVNTNKRKEVLDFRYITQNYINLNLCIIVIYTILFEVVRHRNSFIDRQIFAAISQFFIYTAQVIEIHKYKNQEKSKFISIFKITVSIELALLVIRIAILISQDYGFIDSLNEVPIIPLSLLWALLIINIWSYISIHGFWTERIVSINTKSKIENIIRQEMDRSGALEVLMPT